MLNFSCSWGLKVSHGEVALPEEWHTTLRRCVAIIAAGMSHDGSNALEHEHGTDTPIGYAL